jgi:hypothetical protein
MPSTMLNHVDIEFVTPLIGGPLGDVWSRRRPARPRIQISFSRCDSDEHGRGQRSIAGFHTDDHTKWFLVPSNHFTLQEAQPCIVTKAWIIRDSRYCMSLYTLKELWGSARTKIASVIVYSSCVQSPRDGFVHTPLLPVSAQRMAHTLAVCSMARARSDYE